MPTTLVAVSSFDVKWLEPYASAALNRKNLASTPTGVYRGFVLSSTGVGGTPILTISADPVSNDHVAVVQTVDGNYSLLCRQTSGNFTIDMTPVASTTQVVCVSVSYTIGVATTANIVSYLLSDYNALSAAAKRALAVLGTVIVPAVGNPIPTTSVLADRRTMAWESVAAEAVAWSPLLLNTSFEVGPSGISGNHKYQASFWENTSSGVGSWIVANGAANSGSHSMQVTLSGAGATTGYLYQFLGIPCTTGRRVKISGAAKVAQTITSGTVAGQIEFVDQTGAVTVTSTIALTLPASGAGWAPFEAWLTVPASVFGIKTAGIQLTAMTMGAGGAGIDFDDVQFFMEVPTHDREPQESRTGQIYSSGLVVKDPTALYSALKGLLTFDSTTPASEGRVIGQRWDLDASLLPPQLRWLGRGEFGAGLLTSGAQAVATPRLQTTLFASGWTLIWQTLNGAGVIERIYGDSNGSLYFTSNVSYNNTNYVKDVAGHAHMVQIGGTDGQVSFYRKSSGLADPPTTFTTWDLVNPFNIKAKTRVGFENLGLNTLTPDNTIKALLSLQLNGSGNLSYNFTTFGVSSFNSISASPSYVEVVLQNAIAGPMVFVSNEFVAGGSVNYVTDSLHVDTTHVRIRLRKPDGTFFGGAFIDTIVQQMDILFTGSTS